MKLDPLANPTGSDGTAERRPDLRGAALAAADASPAADWRRAHEVLLAQERAFGELVMRYAQGQASPQELEAGRREVQALRDLADAVLEKGFGLAKERRGA